MRRSKPLSILRPRVLDASHTFPFCLVAEGRETLFLLPFHERMQIGTRKGSWARLSPSLPVACGGCEVGCIVGVEALLGGANVIHSCALASLVLGCKCPAFLFETV